MTAEELTKLVRAQGWRIEWSKRYKTRYAYAAKGSKPHVIRRYLCGEHGLENLNADDVVRKLKISV